MIEMYLFSIISNLSILVLIILILTAILFVALIMAYLTGDFYDDDEESKIKIWIKRVFIILISVSILSVFIPSQSQLIKIVGIGGTVDYIQSNETVKQLPDKCIKALDLYLEETLNEK
jgi:hypothetical protein